MSQWRVRIRFQRVQSFLFALPRLRDMVGANVLLGETLRVRLPKLAIAHGAAPVPRFTVLPPADHDDPLDDVPHVADKDDPGALYASGVLARDGGNFSAVFGDSGAAQRFRDEAEALLVRELSGLRFSIRAGPLVGGAEGAERRAEEHAFCELPQFQVCEVSGNGRAERKYGRERASWASRSVRRRRIAYERFRKGGTRDIIGLIDAALPSVGKRPQDFHDLCGNDYMAVVHADGNDIGKRSEAARGVLVEDTDEAVLEREARGERFYHSTRLAVRRAVVEALDATFGAGKPHGDAPVTPYQLLMLGGDDLLLVCRANAAIPFVVRYAHALDALKRGGLDAPTVGAGIVIATPSLPFHHLHRLAESLTASAKRLYRRCALDGNPRSVVDWLVCTGSWADDPIALRKQESVVRYPRADGATETLALSRRPLPILKEEGDPSSWNSLEGMSEAAACLTEAVKRGEVARSQLRYLQAQLRNGRSWSTMVLSEMPDDARDCLDRLRLVLWADADGSGDRWTTSLSDLVEMSEIDRLSTSRRRA